jgi:hypothetical protein
MIIGLPQSMIFEVSRACRAIMPAGADLGRVLALLADSPVIRCRQADSSGVSQQTDSHLAVGACWRQTVFPQAGNQKGRLTMTEQNQTPDIAGDEDVEGHKRHFTIKADDIKDDDAEGHSDRGTEDDNKDDDTEGHEHYR